MIDYWRKNNSNPKEIGLIKHFSKIMMNGGNWNKQQYLETTRSSYGQINSRLIGIRKDRKLLCIEINHDFNNIEIQFGLLEKLDKVRFPIYHLEKARKFLEELVRKWK